MAQFRFAANIPKYVRKHCKDVVKKLEVDIGDTKGLQISVVDAKCIGFLDTSDEAWGVFALFPGNIPKIMIAGHMHQHSLQKLVYNGKRDLGFMAEVIAHELVHYEQFRKGKKIQERGVRRRSKNLCVKHGFYKSFENEE